MNIIKNYLINLSVLSVTWGGLFRRSFNCDTLFHMVAQEGDIYVRLADGRYLWALMDYLFFQLGISTTDHTGVTVSFSLILLAAGVCFVQEIFKDYLILQTVREKIAFLTITNLLFVNVLFAEVLMFSECALAFALAYMLAPLGGYLFKQKKYGLVFISMLCSVCFYQIGAILGAVLIACIIFLENFYQEEINMKKIAIEGIVGGICTFGVAFINMMSSRLLVWMGVMPELRKVPRINGVGEKIKLVIVNFVDLLRDSKTLLPSLWIPLLVIIICFMILLICTIRNNLWKRLIGIILLFVLMNAMIFVIPFMTEGVNCPPRIVFPFYASMSMLLIMTFQCVNDAGRKVIAGVGVLFFLIQVIFSQMIISDHLLSNKLDILYANLAYQKIKKYERDTGISVEYLAVTRDIDCPPFYDGVKYHTDQINERALGIVTNTLMNVTTAGEYYKVDMDMEVYDQYFKDKDWKYFDLDEQMIIIGSTAYWIIF